MSTEHDFPETLLRLSCDDLQISIDETAARVAHYTSRHKTYGELSRTENIAWETHLRVLMMKTQVQAARSLGRMLLEVVAQNKMPQYWREKSKKK